MTITRRYFTSRSLLDYLATARSRHPDGITAEAIAQDLRLGLSAVRRRLAGLEGVGYVVHKMGKNSKDRPVKIWLRTSKGRLAASIMDVV